MRMRQSRKSRSGTRQPPIEDLRRAGTLRIPPNLRRLVKNLNSRIALCQKSCGSRFAHLAYEAIQSDILKEAMINDHNMLDKFFDFLDITTEMDPLRCAYFSRIVELLFERYPKELISYLKKKNCVVAKFVWHINNQYIVESLFRLIDSQISHQWLLDEDLIPLLMFKMAECEDPETQEKTANTFVEILDLFVPFPYSILTTQMFHSEIVAEQWEQFTLSEVPFLLASPTPTRRRKLTRTFFSTADQLQQDPERFERGHRHSQPLVRGQHGR